MTVLNAWKLPPPARPTERKNQIVVLDDPFEYVVSAPASYVGDLDELYWAASSVVGDLTWHEVPMPATSSRSKPGVVFITFATAPSKKEWCESKIRARLAVANREPDRVAPTADGGNAMYFFGPTLLQNGAHARYAMIDCTDDGISVLLEDRVAHTLVTREPDTDAELDQAIVAIDNFLAE